MISTTPLLDITVENDVAPLAVIPVTGTYFVADLSNARIVTQKVEALIEL